MVFEAWIPALAGGVLIGLSSVLLLWLNGRIAGISGIMNGVLLPKSGETSWRIAFLLGLIAAAGLYIAFVPGAPQPRQGFSTTGLIIAGLLVGFGTSMGNGCTSGHGVCGLGRFSVRSLAAVLVFMATAMLTTFLLRHVWGCHESLAGFCARRRRIVRARPGHVRHDRCTHRAWLSRRGRRLRSHAHVRAGRCRCHHRPAVHADPAWRSSPVRKCIPGLEPQAHRCTAAGRCRAVRHRLGHRRILSGSRPGGAWCRLTGIAVVCSRHAGGQPVASTALPLRTRLPSASAGV
ncbi:MAG: YeeE/YedE family protein [Dokdonella sp.]|nr:YeeE/YedE family protein [Dokdonella sp.]